jgi:hypothetical protein
MPADASWGQFSRDVNGIDKRVCSIVHYISTTSSIYVGNALVKVVNAFKHGVE